MNRENSNRKRSYRINELKYVILRHYINKIMFASIISLRILKNISFERVEQLKNIIWFIMCTVAISSVMKIKQYELDT